MKNETVDKRVKRSNFYNELFNVIKTIPREKTTGDATDAASAALACEQLCLKQQIELLQSAGKTLSKTVNINNKATHEFITKKITELKSQLK